MTWKQYYIDFAVLLMREGGCPQDVAAIFTVAFPAIYALLRSRGYSMKELKEMPPLPQKDRSKIIQKFCEDPANAEALRSLLNSYGICFEDFATQPFSNFAERINKIVDKKPKISERNIEIAELRRQGMTLRAIGQQYGITRERARQIILRYNKLADNPVDIVKARMLGYRPSPKVLERQNKIVELCRAGLTYRQIAETLGIEKKVAFQDIARYNRTATRLLKVRREDNRKVTDQIRADIIRERKKGTTNYAIAERFGIAYGTVCRVIKVAGLTRQRRTPKTSKRIKRVKIAKPTVTKRATQKKKSR